MIRVVRKTSVGVAGTAAVVGAGLGAVACNVEVEDGVDAVSAADTATVAPGEGIIQLSYYEFQYRSTSGGDEFIRANDKLKMAVSVRDAVYVMSLRNYEASRRMTDASKVGAKLKLTFSNGDRKLDIVRAVTWNGTDGLSAEVVVPSGYPRMTLTLIVDELDAPSGTTPGHVEAGSDLYRRATFAIFGAFADNKLALFDTEGSKSRVRIVEGGTFSPGRNATLSYTDWRADTFVDKTALNRTIGKARSYSRFGPGVMEIHGEFFYQISANYSTDGGRSWTENVLFDALQHPDVLNIPDDYMRRAFQKTLAMPKDAQSFEVAFRIRAYLKADPRGQYIEQWYNGPDGRPFRLGETYLLKETWDNNGGRNYKFEVKP